MTENQRTQFEALNAQHLKLLCTQFSHFIGTASQDQVFEKRASELALQDMLADCVQKLVGMLETLPGFLSGDAKTNVLNRLTEVNAEATVLLIAQALK